MRDDLAFDVEVRVASEMPCDMSAEVSGSCGCTLTTPSSTSALHKMFANNDVVKTYSPPYTPGAQLDC
jgi:hypothetical protein